MEVPEKYANSIFINRPSAAHFRVTTAPCLFELVLLLFVFGAAGPGGVGRGGGLERAHPNFSRMPPME